VGRCLQDHPNAYSAEVLTASPDYFQDRYALFYGRRSRWFPRLTLAPEAQRRLETLQAAAVVAFDYPEDSAVSAIRRVIRHGDYAGFREIMGKPRALGRVPSELAHIGWRRYVRGRSPAVQPQRILLQVFTEQEPDPVRRVALGAPRDALGLPVARINWSVSDREVDAARVLTFAIRDEFERLGLGRVVPEPWLLDGDSAYFRDAYHHIGTTRMSTDPRRGVVNPDLQVHGVRGLYSAGASSFPSSSWANPVLTAVALTLRVADHLRRNGLRRP
jgi:choline dehydrogenase-like flavoprotein